jgi:hypothetical protein
VHDAVTACRNKKYTTCAQDKKKYTRSNVSFFSLSDREREVRNERAERSEVERVKYLAPSGSEGKK